MRSRCCGGAAIFRIALSWWAIHPSAAFGVGRWCFRCAPAHDFFLSPADDAYADAMTCQSTGPFPLPNCAPWPRRRAGRISATCDSCSAGRPSGSMKGRRRKSRRKPRCPKCCRARRRDFVPKAVSHCKTAAPQKTTNLPFRIPHTPHLQTRLTQTLKPSSSTTTPPPHHTGTHTPSTHYTPTQSNVALNNLDQNPPPSSYFLPSATYPSPPKHTQSDTGNNSPNQSNPSTASARALTWWLSTKL